MDLHCPIRSQAELKEKESGGFFKQNDFLIFFFLNFFFFKTKINEKVLKLIGKFNVEVLKLQNSSIEKGMKMKWHLVVIFTSLKFNISTILIFFFKKKNFF